MAWCNAVYFIAVLFVLIVKVASNEEESASLYDYSSSGEDKGN